jgi:hypothetical protein
LNFANLNVGTGGSIYAYGNPVTIAYSSAGLKTISAQVYSTQTGAYCNGGNALSTTVNALVATGSSTSSLACNVVLSANPVNRNQAVLVGFQATGGNGAVSLLNLIYPTNSGITGQYISATQANLTFGSSGQIPFSITVRDSVGATAICSTTVTVY